MSKEILSTHNISGWQDQFTQYAKEVIEINKKKYIIRYALSITVWIKEMANIQSLITSKLNKKEQ